jgi:hypothetical protein
MRQLRWVRPVLWSLATASAVAAALAGDQSISVKVQDQTRQPVPGVVVHLGSGSAAAIAGATTDRNGAARFAGLEPGHYQVTAEKDGFAPATCPGLDLALGAPATVELTLLPAVRRESVEVHGEAAPMERDSSAPDGIPSRVARELPSRPATVADALPLVPGVARTPGGGLQISGGAEHRSALIVNSADVTDPATGQFGLTVPMDSVETLHVYQTPFLAEFGRFTAGLVSVETRRGTDQWKWELNDPFPEFRIRSWDLRGLRTATPRLNAEGPIVPGKLYFSEGFEYALRKTAVFTLPFPENQKIQEGVNSFAQLDWVVSSKQLVTATVHVAPQRLDHVNMDYFNPRPTTPDARTHNYTTTLADRLTLGGGLLENTLSLTRFDARVWGQGTADLVLQPGGNSGSYFAQQDRNAERLGWLSTYSLAPISAWGTHNIKAGTYMAGSWDAGRASAHPVDLLDASGQLVQQIAFTGGRPFQMTDMEYDFFGQDHWVISPTLSVDLGLRAESQAVSEALRVAPRAGVSWSPFARGGTVIRSGAGMFYDHVPLNVYAFSNYPGQVITMYNPAGQVSGGPYTYLNTLGVVSIAPRLVFQEPGAGNFSPRSVIWSFQVEQPVTPFLKLRVGYLQNSASGLIVLNRIAADPLTGIGANLLNGAGQSRYHQFETTAKARIGSGGQLLFSYVRSRARGDLNEFNSFLGSFPAPILRPDQFANLPTDLPNRFLTWGLVPLPWKVRIAPSIELRSGFPYSLTDAAQNYSGVPNQSRFPDFISFDSRISKDFQVSPKYALRLSVSGFNLTNHFNPEAVHYNTGDAAAGLFFGHRGRHFTIDFDVIF